MFWPVRDFLVKFLFVKGIASSQVSHKLLLQMLPRVSKKEENNLSLMWQVYWPEEASE